MNRQRNFINGLAVLGLSLLVAACGSSGPKPGAYYQDDGPGSRSASEFVTAPDAQPRDEPVYAASTRPYQILGRQYVPLTERQPFNQSGVASWYGKQFQGKPTSIGEPYDMYAMTGAHPTLPLPSYVRVRNLENDRSVVVRINDRGPFSNGRIIDLSFAAAAKLGYVQKGTTLVSIEVVDPVVVAMAGDRKAAAKAPVAISTRKARALAPRTSQETTASLPVPGFPQSQPRRVTRSVQDLAPAPVAAQVSRDKSGQREVRLGTPRPAIKAAPAELEVSAYNAGNQRSAIDVRIETLKDQGLRPAIPEPDLDPRAARRDPLKPRDWSEVNATPESRAEVRQIAAIEAENRRVTLNEKDQVPEKASIYLQFGAYATEKAAREDMYRYSGMLSVLFTPVEILAERGLHKIQAGPFASAKDAEAAIKRIRRESTLSPFYVYR